jgi:aminopeptidase N
MATLTGRSLRATDRKECELREVPRSLPVTPGVLRIENRFIGRLPMPKIIAIVSALLLSMSQTVGAAAEPPLGRLPETVTPSAYRLDFNVDPKAASFSGHVEIDAVLAQPSSSIFLHGNGLKVSKARVTAGDKSYSAHYTQVDPSGVARLDLPGPLPAGKLTLQIEYTSNYRTSAEGLFHAKVGGDWYAWTQMEPIDARRVFPGFDEPGFKTPFTLNVTAPKSA